MAQLNITNTGLGGSAVAMVAATAGGDSFTNTGSEHVRVNNGSAAAITVTFKGQKPCDQGVIHDDAVSVAAGATVDFGTFSGGRFNDSSGNVQITYSAVASVTVGVYR